MEATPKWSDLSYKCIGTKHTMSLNRRGVCLCAVMEGLVNTERTHLPSSPNERPCCGQMQRKAAKCTHLTSPFMTAHQFRQFDIVVGPVGVQLVDKSSIISTRLTAREPSRLTAVQSFHGTSSAKPTHSICRAVMPVDVITGGHCPYVQPCPATNDQLH